MFRPPQLCAVWGRVALAATLLVAVPGVARAQFERASISGTVTDQQGGVVPGVTVTAVQVTTQQSRTAVTDASGFYSIASLMPGKYDISVELDGFKKTTRAAVQLDAAASVTLAFTLETGALTEVVTVTSRGAAAPDRRHRPQDGRSQGPRAALVLGPQPAGRPGAEGRRDRRQLQQPGLRRVQQRRLQHQRRPLRREQHHGRRRRRHPHPVGRHHHRHPERGYAPGNPGPDRQLHARVRARQRRPDPVRDQERQPELHGQRVVLPARRVAAGQLLVPQPRQRRHPEPGPGAVRLQAVRLLLRRSDSAQQDEGQAVLLRRAGVGELLPARDPQRHGPDRSHAPRRLQRAAGREQRLLHAAAAHHRPADRPAVPGQHHPEQPAVAERRGDHERVSAADARLPAGHPERDPDQRERAGSAQGQHPPRLPAEPDQPADLSLLAVVVHRAEPLRR